MRVKHGCVTYSHFPDVLPSALALGLMGGAVALFSKKDQPQGVDRQGVYDPGYGIPRQTYAQRVNEFEKRFVSKISNRLSGVTNNARRVTGRIRNAVRRAGQRSLGVLRRGGDAISRMATNTDRSLRGMGRFRDLNVSAVCLLNAAVCLHISAVCLHISTTHT